MLRVDSIAASAAQFIEQAGAKYFLDAVATNMSLVQMEIECANVQYED